MSGLLSRFVDYANGVITADVNNTTTDADDLDIGGSDFLTTGTFIPSYTFNTVSKREVTFSNTTFQGDDQLINTKFEWEDMFPSEVQTAVMGGVFVSTVGTSETIDLEIRNTVDAETVTNLTGITTTGMQMQAPVAYTPTTTTSHTKYQWRWRESDGSNSSAVADPFLVFGILV